LRNILDRIEQHCNNSKGHNTRKKRVAIRYWMNWRENEKRKQREIGRMIDKDRKKKRKRRKERV